jgi:ABC-type phosphate/phosphonate transport system substrate-binding protein
MQNGFTRRAFLGTTLPAACLLLRGRVFAAEITDAATIRIGLVNSMFRDVPEPMIQLMSKPFRSLMEDQAGVIGNVVCRGPAQKLAQQLKEQEVQLGVFHGFEFAWARKANPDLKPLMIAVAGTITTRALLIVAAHNPMADATNLQGKVFALPLLAREHCRLFAERRCAQNGTPMEKWFARVLAPRTSEAALHDVADGAAQATVVDDVEYADYCKRYPKTGEKFRVVMKSEPFPSPVIAYQPGGMAEATLTRLQQGMIAAKATARGRDLLELCRITAFEAVPADYDQSLNDIIKAYPPPVK